ncbi:MAG: hypothetical protein Kow00124_25990 [Anaerolineae bacterium]
MTIIRPALPGDLEGIRSIIRAVWGVDLLPESFYAQIEGPDAAIWVAADGTVEGFISGFKSVGLEGVHRWELDLLAVAPGSQGRGLGRLLVEAAWQDAVARGVDLVRGLVRYDNLASSEVFKAAGFTSDGRLHDLYLWLPWDGEPVTPALPPGVLLLPVETLTYRGLWVEGLDPVRLTPDEQREAVIAARVQTAAEKRRNAGAVIPAALEHHLDPLLRDEAALHGVYHWWTRIPGR